MSDPISPGGATVDARYGAHCRTDCPATGGEFSAEFTGMGHPGWPTARVDHLKGGFPLGGALGR